MNYPLLLAYTLSIVLLIATPGPVVALVLNTAASAGRRQAFCTILGTNGASLLLIGLSSLVISGLLLVRDGWLAGLSLLGSLVLLWYAATALRSAWGSAAILLGYATLLHTAFFQQHRHWVARLSALFLLAVAVGGLEYAVHGLLFTPSP